MGTLVRCPSISKSTPVLGPVSTTTVATIWPTASSMLLPVIAPKAAFMFTVTMPDCDAADSPFTLLGMAVAIPCGSELLGPSRSAPSTEASGAGAATKRCTAVSALVALRKNTCTDTYDVGFGWVVVVVVGGCGSRRSKGTFDGPMVLGELWVGMAQPAATTASVASASTAMVMRRLTPAHHPRPRRRP